MITSTIDLLFVKSKLHTGTNLSTMENEIIVLAHSCHELFPVVDMAKYLSGDVVLLIRDTTIPFISIILARYFCWIPYHYNLLLVEINMLIRPYIFGRKFTSRK